MKEKTLFQKYESKLLSGSVYIFFLFSFFSKCTVGLFQLLKSTSSLPLDSGWKKVPLILQHKDPAVRCLYLNSFFGLMYPCF